MAISGQSFCSSAQDGFLLNVKHGMKFYWANLLADLFMFLGKIAVVCLNCFSLYMIMAKVTHDLKEVSSIWGPIVVVGIETYMAASIFLGLFDEAVIALLHCVCADTDLNGSPIYGPPTFHDGDDGQESKLTKASNAGNKKRRDDEYELATRGNEIV